MKIDLRTSDLFKGAFIEYGAVTHAGRKRVNQDMLSVPPANGRFSERGRIFAVADGIGGHNGGDVASRLACQGLDRYYQDSISGKPPWGAIDLSRHLEETVFRIDRLIRLQGFRNASLADMGTTLSCLVLTSEQAIIAHVGDSRIYLLRRGYLTCLTTDHNFVQDMIFEGEVDPEKAAEHPMRHFLTRAVGTPESLDRVDIRVDPLKTGDRFLLCSDGLFNSLRSEQIASILSRPWAARRIAATLASEALCAGAIDNITALVVKND